jgi:hypothetical protein
MTACVATRSIRSRRASSLKKRSSRDSNSAMSGAGATRRGGQRHARSGRQLHALRKTRQFLRDPAGALGGELLGMPEVALAGRCGDRLTARGIDAHRHVSRARIHDQLERHAPPVDRFDLGLNGPDLLSRIEAHARRVSRAPLTAQVAAVSNRQSAIGNRQSECM